MKKYLKASHYSDRIYSRYDYTWEDLRDVYIDEHGDAEYYDEFAAWLEDQISNEGFNPSIEDVTEFYRYVYPDYIDEVGDPYYASTKITSSKYVGAGKDFSGYISEKIRDEIYNAVADVLMQYPELSGSEQKRYTKQAFDWFMDRYFMYDFDDLNG